MHVYKQIVRPQDLSVYHHWRVHLILKDTLSYRYTASFRFLFFSIFFNLFYSLCRNPKPYLSIVKTTRA